MSSGGGTGGSRVAILGHTGFIGGHVFRALERARPDFELVGGDLPRLDLTDAEQAEALADLFAPDVAVVMCSGIKRQLGDTLDTFSANVAMVVNVCRVLEKHPVGRFVYLSSGAVYGEERTDTSISEATPADPTSAYGIAKLASERLLLRTLASHEASLVLLRPPQIYGPGDIPAYGPSGFLRDALSHGTITLWGDGRELREFVFVEDVAALVARLVEGEFAGVLNAVHGMRQSFRDAAEIACRLVPGTRIETKPRSRPKADHAFSAEAVRRLFPDLEPTSLESGMARTLAGLSPA